MSVLTKIMSPITSNRPAQLALEKTVKLCLQLMGVGTGAGAWSSGERSMIKSVLSTSGKHPCIFDVGANKGQFLSLLLDVLNDRAASIHCFEPSSVAFQALQATAKDDARVTLTKTALGRQSGEATLYFDEPGSGMASLTNRRLPHLKIAMSHQETVAINSVDHYCQQHQIKHIDLLKMDVEGHELDVLAGATNMLKQQRVSAVTFEFGGCNIDTRTYFQDFFYLFQDLDMQLFRISPSGYACQVKKYREIYEQFRTTNFFAVRDAA